jgi:hypothetical protein
VKTVIAVAITVLIMAGGAFAAGSALDPRVPGLQRQVRALQSHVNTLQAQMSGKLDKSCVQYIQLVIRPGYVYQANDGSLIIYKAVDEYNPAIDSTPNKVLVYAPGC